MLFSKVEIVYAVLKTPSNIENCQDSQRELKWNFERWVYLRQHYIPLSSMLAFDFFLVSSDDLLHFTIRFCLKNSLLRFSFSCRCGCLLWLANGQQWQYTACVNVGAKLSTESSRQAAALSLASLDFLAGARRLLVCGEILYSLTQY